MPRILFTPFVLAAVLFSSVAAAEKVEDTRTICLNQRGVYSFDQVSGACQAQIDAGGDERSLYEARISLGIAFGDRGDFNRSVMEFTQAVQLLPDETAAYNNRGIAFRNLGRYDAAIADYDEALRINPQNARTLNNRCWARAVTGRDLDLALEDCNASLQIEPDANTNDTRCIVYLRLQNYQAAFEDCDLAHKGMPREARSLYGRGLAQRGLGRATEAEVDIQAALALRPSVAEEFASFGIE